MSLEPDRDSSPRALELLPILIIAPVMAPAVWWAMHSRVTLPVFLTFTAASAALVGLPLLFWALDHSRTQLKTLVVLGVVAGGLPMPAVLVSGGLGRLIQGGVPHLERILSRGAPIPTVGVMRWADFAVAELQGVMIGAACGVIYWACRSWWLRSRNAT